MDVFLVPSTTLGGAEGVMRSLICAASRAMRPVTVVFLTGTDIDRWNLHDSVKVVFLRAWKEKIGQVKLVGALLGLRRNCRIERIFTSHAHLTAQICLMRRLGVMSKATHVARESTVIADRFFGLRRLEFRVMYSLYSRIDLLICQTGYMKKRLVEFVPKLIGYNIVVLPNPIDCERVCCLADNEPGVDITWDEDYIVAVGRLIPEKGFDLLIQAFKDLLDPTMHLVIIGDGVERKLLEKQIIDLELSSRVHLVGFLRNPYPLLKGAAIGVVSSRREGFPNTLLEMMAVCRRVVATRCAGGVDDLPGIEVCAADSVDSLKEGVRRALLADPGQAMPLMRSEVLKRSPVDYLRRVDGLIPANQK